MYVAIYSFLPPIIYSSIISPSADRQMDAGMDVKLDTHTGTDTESPDPSRYKLTSCVPSFATPASISSCLFIHTHGVITDHRPQSADPQGYLATGLSPTVLHTDYHEHVWANQRQRWATLTHPPGSTAPKVPGRGLCDLFPSMPKGGLVANAMKRN